MISIFFYRQYPCHIGKTDIRLILHPVPQKIQIFPPVIFFTPRFPENTVPFINQDDKGSVFRKKNIIHRIYNASYIRIFNSRIFLSELMAYPLIYFTNHQIHIDIAAVKLLHIDQYHFVPVPICFTGAFASYFHIAKHFAAVCFTVIIS